MSIQKKIVNMLKIVRKSGFDPIVGYFRTIIYIFTKKILQWNSKCECTKNFIKFLLQDKKLSRLQNPNFVIFSKKMLWLRKSPHMQEWDYCRDWPKNDCDCKITILSFSAKKCCGSGNLLICKSCCKFGLLSWQYLNFLNLITKLSYQALSLFNGNY